MNKLMRIMVCAAAIFAVAQPAFALNDTIGVTAGTPGKTANLISFASTRVISEVGFCDATTENQCGSVNASGQLAVTLPNGADVVLGSLNDAPTCAAGNTLMSAVRCMDADIKEPTAISTWAGGTLGAMANWGSSPGAVLSPSVNSSTFYGTTPLVADPCQANTPIYLSFAIPTGTTTNILTGTAAKKIYVCYLYLQTGVANNVAIIQGTTGGTCGSGTAALGPGGTTAATALINAANSGQAFGNGASTVMATNTNNNDICVVTSASGPLSGLMKYVVQ